MISQTQITANQSHALRPGPESHAHKTVRSASLPAWPVAKRQAREGGVEICVGLSGQGLAPDHVHLPSACRRHSKYGASIAVSESDPGRFGIVAKVGQLDGRPREGPSFVKYTYGKAARWAKLIGVALRNYFKLEPDPVRRKRLIGTIALTNLNQRLGTTAIALAPGFRGVAAALALGEDEAKAFGFGIVVEPDCGQVRFGI